MRVYDLMLWRVCTRRKSAARRTGTCGRWPASTASRRWSPSGTWAPPPTLPRRREPGRRRRCRSGPGTWHSGTWPQRGASWMTSGSPRSSMRRPGRARPGSRCPRAYLVLAALNLLVAPCSKAAFADWWKTTAAGRFTKIPASALDHRRFWDAMHAVTAEQLEEASRAIAVKIVQAGGVDVSSVALDMTNFATFIATANGKAPIAQRGKAKQKRSDLRLIGLGLVVTRDGGIPLTWHAYPGDKPDVTQFTTMIDQLLSQYQVVTTAAGFPASAADMTVVFDAGQNSEDNFAHLAGTGLHYIGSVPASDCPDLTALPASVRDIADKDRFGGLTAYDTRRETYGAQRRTTLTHSPELHESQARGFDGTTLAKAGRKLDGLAATLARGKTRRSKEKVTAEIEKITAKPWVRRVITWQLAGGQPKDLRLTWHIDPQARAE